MNNLLLAAVTSVSLLLSCSAIAGDWVEVPAAPLDTFSTLAAVTAAGNGDVWATGSLISGSRTKTLVEHWDGVSWSQVKSPNASASFNTLVGAATVNRRDVWAVGRYVQSLAHGGVLQTLVEHWNGRRWQLIPSPNVAGDGIGSYLTSVSPVAADDVWAVGAWINQDFDGHTLTMHWDGTTWAIVPSPTQQDDILFAIEALASDDVWAVGQTGTDSFTDLTTLILHWDGTSWSRVTSPNVTGTNNVLSGITAIGPDDIWAVGYTGNITVSAKTLALHWDGTAWNIVPTILGNLHYTCALALATDSVWAAGANDTSDQPISHHWTGSAWSNVVVPAAVSRAVINSITATPNGTLWAVGTQSSEADPLIYMKAP